MADLTLRVTLTARNQADRALRSTRDRVRETDRFTRQLDKSARTVAGRWLDISRNSGLNNRLIRQQSREYDRLQRQARRLNFEEVRRTEQLRKQEREVRQAARRSLGVGVRRGPGFDPDAPATNLGAAASAVDRFSAAGERGIRSIASSGFDFSRAVAEVTTISDLSRQEIERTALDSARAFGQVPVEQTKALYQVISAGYTDAASMATVFEQANKGAVAGVSSTEEAFDALNAIMRPYGMAATDAARANDLLFTTVRDAKTTIPELGQSLAQATPLAAEAGIEVEELLASFSALTAGVGMNTRQAATAMRGFSAKIIKPSEQARKEWARLKKGSDDLKGFKDMQDALKALGVQGFLQAIQGSKKFRKETFGKLFEDVEGLAAVLSLSGESADEFARAMGHLEGSAGSAQKAFDKMAADPSFELKQMNAEWEEMKISLSRDLIPALIEMGREVRPILHDLAKLARENPWLAKVALGMVAGGKIAGPVLHGMSGLAGLAGGRGFGTFAGQRAVIGGQTAIGRGNVAASGAIAGSVGVVPALVGAAAAGYALGTALDEATGASDFLSKKLYEASGSGFWDRLNAPGFSDVGSRAEHLEKLKRELVVNEQRLKEHRGTGALDALGFGLVGLVRGGERRALEDESARLQADIRRREGGPSQAEANFANAKGALESLGIELRLKVDQDGRVTGANLASAKGARVDLTTDVGVTRG